MDLRPLRNILCFLICAAGTMACVGFRPTMPGAPNPADVPEMNVVAKQKQKDLHVRMVLKNERGAEVKDVPSPSKNGCSEPEVTIRSAEGKVYAKGRMKYG